MNAPAPLSAAVRDLPRTDHVSVVTTPLPPGATTDPRVWADALFDVSGMPGWVRAAMHLRQRLVVLVGIAPAGRDTFAVQRVEPGADGSEALISSDEGHLDFRCAVGVAPTAGRVSVVTAVALHGWRGHLYFAPVRVVHPLAVRALLRGAARRLTP